MSTFLEMTVDQLAEQMIKLGEKKFRADQLFDWVYRKGVVDAKSMSNLPASLVEKFPVLDSTVERRQESSDGVIKLLVRLSDGQCVECVMIPTDDRVTACISTQVGCAMGCVFCASGIGGVVRNLSAGEILQQLIHLRTACNRRITNVVFMGMGEPLANYDATVGAVRAIIDLKRFAISARSVTVSTVGIPQAIRKLADEDIPITLAISLHAPNDEIRRQLIPMAKRYPINEVIEAADYFFASRKREVTLEYILIKDINDTNVCADALAKICHQMRCNVNLIRYNPVAPLKFDAPSVEDVRKFAAWLTKKGVNANIRKSRGVDIDSACGQLRAKTEHNSEIQDSGQTA